MLLLHIECHFNYISNFEYNNLKRYNHYWIQNWTISNNEIIDYKINDYKNVLNKIFVINQILRKIFIFFFLKNYWIFYIIKF